MKTPTIEPNAPFTKREKALVALLGLFLLSCLFGLCGCATKTRSVELDGMYVSEAGTLAIGSVEVMASPVGEEAAIIKYDEDTAWLSPSTKTHAIKIQLVGSNSVEQVSGLVRHICKAFVPTAAIINGSTNSVAPAVTNSLAPSPSSLSGGAASAAQTSLAASSAATTNAVEAVQQ